MVENMTANRKVEDVVKEIEYCVWAGAHEVVDRLIVELFKMLGYGEHELNIGNVKYVINIEKACCGFSAYMSATMAKMYGMATDFDGGLHGYVAIVKTNRQDLKRLQIWYADDSGEKHE